MSYTPAELTTATDRQRRLMSGEKFNEVYSTLGWDFTRDRNIIIVEYLKLPENERNPLLFPKEPK